VAIQHDGEISQTIERQDLSFYLELSYEVRSVLYDPTASASSEITYYVTDQTGRGDVIAIVGHAQTERQTSFERVKVNLFGLFRGNVGPPEAFTLKKVKITLRLTFQGLPLGVAPSLAYFRNVSLKRMNPVRLALKERYRESINQTVFSVIIINVGDLDASNIIVRLDLSPDLSIISEKMIFQRPILEGNSSWEVSWTLVSKSSGKYPLTVRVNTDQTERQLQTRIPVQKPEQKATSQNITTTSSRSDYAQIHFNPMLIVAIIAGVVIVIVIVFAKRHAASTSMAVPAIKEEAKSRIESSRKITEEAEKKTEDYQRYLNRLEELKAQGKISEKVYARLMQEYKKRLENEANGS